MNKNRPKKIATNNAWTNAHYDRINLAIPKGGKDEIRTHAEKRGESMNGFICRAIGEQIKRDDEQEEENK